MSLLSWERGLKCQTSAWTARHSLSLLSWERGLKSYRSICDIRRLGVAPLVGAWIEIRALAMKILEETVAPLVGAWIEITKSRITQLILSSLLSWERGLK